MFFMVKFTELHLLHGLLALHGAARGEHHRGAGFGQAHRGLAAQAWMGWGDQSWSLGMANLMGYLAKNIGNMVHDWDR